MRRDLANARMGSFVALDGRTFSLRTARIERAEVEELIEAHKLLRRIRREEDAKPMQLFHISISYLALLSVAIIVDVFL